MNKLMRYLGIVIILLGFLCLFAYFLGMMVSNTTLIVAACLMVGGVVAHVILNKIFFED